MLCFFAAKKKAQGMPRRQQNNAERSYASANHQKRSDQKK